MAVTIPDEMAKGYREQEKLRLYHNELGKKIVTFFALVTWVGEGEPPELRPAFASPGGSASDIENSDDWAYEVVSEGTKGAVLLYGDGSKDFEPWRILGFPVASAPESLSLTQFRTWQGEWFKPTSMSVSETVAPLKDAVAVAQAALDKVEIMDVDLSSIKDSLKESTLYDAEIDLDSIYITASTAE